jgi:hypothetical protein
MLALTAGVRFRPPGWDGWGVGRGGEREPQSRSDHREMKTNGQGSVSTNLALMDMPVVDVMEDGNNEENMILALREGGGRKEAPISPVKP